MLDRIEAKLVIKSMRGRLLLEFAKGRIEYPFLCTIAMPLDHQQSMSVGHHEKERGQSIPIRASLFQCFIQMSFTWLFVFDNVDLGIIRLLLLLSSCELDLFNS